MPCNPPMMFCSIVGSAIFQTAGSNGPSTSDRSKRGGGFGGVSGGAMGSGSSAAGATVGCVAAASLSMKCSSVMNRDGARGAARCGTRQTADPIVMPRSGNCHGSAKDRLNPGSLLSQHASGSWIDVRAGRNDPGTDVALISPRPVLGRRAIHYGQHLADARALLQ